ncbi:NPCBM/NEW2 domain-containing protein [Streptosporangium carneum]|uniref:Glycosyl hydrolase family 98 putative carbohydrate-binding module domain-containing protein n=1 Tax=Streptosporangium carneum TaxID=47481 RepID=A0A9W6I6I7_9ACTN|nr:NPCBM/NEW2 domain-containing protein [Streptosporangium carneum]GLK12083.1 hypothetical protein GCM10017600_54910 [Streptosporangium carneum]
MRLTAGEHYSVSYVSQKWTVDYRNFDYVDARGYPPGTDSKIYQPCKITPGWPYALLLGRVSGSDPLPIGDDRVLTAKRSGHLWLRIHDRDACLGDNKGSVLVKITKLQNEVQRDRNLSELPQVSGGAQHGPADVNGQRYANSVILEVGSWWPTPTNAVEYNLSRHWSDLHATVGVSDDAPADTRMRFEAWADNRRLYRKELGLGQSDVMDLDVSGVLRLRLQATLISGEYANAVWGDAAVGG